MTLKPFTIALIFRAVESLRAGRNVLIVARPRPHAFDVARLLVAVAKRLGIKLANHRGADHALPWVYARGHDDPIELLATHCDVYRDLSATFEQQRCKPKRVRTVQG